ncbi:nitric oxide dioxygenase [Sporothrix schenckii 1099-18]|uniref:nitric oxide dioxygenase n=2 Tax=Sporothrix schenckii TaxID=29908 RepID=U7Q638_SPOS1|nr:nitric oxide dioxygenase [Sporothrix schenckii 1099-18]ERT03354.1 hypothetical protein HMPREF1624_01667 [Sporothrix schenckii ATCC 58251]KJR84207.1 nitric oxide dioxygenase [Sporothrix schenckii 1099-18]
MASAETLQRPDVSEPNGPVTPPGSKVVPAVTPEQISIVKATAPVLKEHGVTITTVFYENMLKENPELKNVFSLTSQATGAQPRALAAAVLGYAMFIDDLPRLHHAVERIAHKHASLQIQPDQYDIVGKYLIQAIGQVLGDAATPSIVDAWTAAYGVLADVFIGRERSLYNEARARDNFKGWAGWRKFRIQRREYAAAPDDEDSGDRTATASKDGILNLYLAPVDGKPLPTYEPGQYVSLQVFVPEFGVLQSRQYSLSRAPRPSGDCYRVSVKRDTGHNGQTTPGLISNLLHNVLKEGDEVELSQPQGEFVVEETPLPTAEDAERPSVPTAELAPIVLLSAGVGATPVMAILETAAQHGRTISWLHGSHSRSVLPFSKEVQALRAAHPERIQTYTVLTTADDADDAAADPVVTGTHLKIAELPDAERRTRLFLDNAKTGYYICGPSSFMIESRDALQSLGVAPERIHLELFETGDL